ncbi:MAG: hypothetical protein EA401_09165 [Planctomycetota bacterium]|nr:MAG: hypothetical protein EA401_09165 [Planctomycetota bacterium]
MKHSHCIQPSRHHRTARFGACMLMLLMATASAAEPLLVFDGEITVTGSGPSFPVREGLPRNWTSPVDYTTGILYIEWDILEAPEDAAEMLLQIGWRLPAQNQRHLVRYKYMRQIGPHYTAPHLVTGASYTTAHRLQNDRCFWPLKPKDYSQGISGLTSMVRNRSWQVAAPSQSVRIHLTMTVVPQGVEYQAPGRYNGISAHDLPDLPQVGAALQNKQPGQALALAEAAKELHAADSSAGQQAQKAVTALREWALLRKDRAEQRFVTDPVQGAEEMIELSQQLSETSLADIMDQRVESLRNDPSLRAELPAHRIWLEMKGHAEALQASTTTRDFSAPEVQQRYQHQLRPLATAYRTLQQRHANSVSLKKAHSLLMDLGILSE